MEDPTEIYGDKVCLRREKRRKTYVCVKDRHKVDPGHQQIVAHVILTLYAGSGTEIGADSDIRRTRYIA
jgi:hypothetical protein